ncbi:MAG: glycosyl transferase family 2 [Ruminococcaceae bacterium]|nr:glycosyl transferase family 2 [Oscillospiraceae bacterium]
MRVYVYAIAKDEIKHVQRFARSMAEADGIYVLDTGSRDGTVDALRDLGVHVTVKEIVPWRFDAARNESMALLPENADICVCADLDEVFRPGWRSALERAWAPGTKQADYRYTWSFTPEGREGHVFYVEKAHARRGFRWKNPVHEVLCYEGEEPYRLVRAEGMQADHFPDESKSRAQYLPLLEQAVAEEPENDRNRHYLGREYMFRGRWDEAVATLKEHLALPTALWRDERCASMRFIARCEEALGRGEEAFSWLLRAIGEAPWLREPWMELCQWMYRREDWEGVYFAAERALRIGFRGESYITEAESWGALPWDLGSLGAYYTGRPDRAAEMAAEALRLAPEDERIRENWKLMCAKKAER